MCIFLTHQKALRSKTKCFCLYNHILGRCNVLPPIIVDSILSACHTREVVEPPFVVSADLTATPFI